MDLDRSVINTHNGAQKIFKELLILVLSITKASNYEIIGKAD